MYKIQLHIPCRKKVMGSLLVPNFFSYKVALVIELCNYTFLL